MSMSARISAAVAALLMQGALEMPDFTRSRDRQ
jgi:hypothetical protein